MIILLLMQPADGLDRWWATLYKGIKWANVVIEKVPLVSMDSTSTKHVIWVKQVSCGDYSILILSEPGEKYRW